MGAMASQITSLTIVYSIVYSDADQRKHQSSASLAFVRGIHRGPMNSPHKWPVTRSIIPFDDVIIFSLCEEIRANMASQQGLHTTSQQKANLLGFPNHVYMCILMYNTGDLRIAISFGEYFIFTAMRCDILGLTKIETAWLYTIFGIVGIPARPLAGLIVDRPEVNRTSMFGIRAASPGVMILVTTTMKTFQLLVTPSVLFCLLSGNSSLWPRFY